MIPDYRVGYSIREFSGQCPDSILAFTTALIEQGGIQSEMESFWTLRKILIVVWGISTLVILYLAIRNSRHLSTIRKALLRKE